ncbi:MAG: EAL domain-containing protein [Rhodoferax sp.]|uniref:putative bifunctional diguanylate cyclase/phosphodiesterase n=1 Tax=Rhodoferax sp. TaxID=50421 RepID=UPI0026294E74|nr:EAL domain-containing protein [Rhodoferax sp.]MDD5335646.1 EAL domain-containing protein [Rhodoferax sp.]
MAIKPVSSAAGEGYDVEGQLLCAAYDRMPLNMVLTVVLPVLLTGLWWSRFPHALLTAWTLVMFVNVAAAYLIWVGFRRAAPTEAALPLWRRLFLLQSVMAGAAWALAPILLLQYAVGTESALFAVLLMAVAGVAINTLAAQCTAMHVFVIAAVLPPAVVAWYTGKQVEQMVALSLLGGMAVLLLIGVQSSQANRAMFGTRLRLRCILDTALDAIIEMDPQRRITGWNRRAETIFGWNRDEVLGRALDDTIIPLHQRDRHRDGVARFLAIGQEQVLNRRMEVSALRSNGQEFPAELAITRIKTGDACHFTAFVSDITERKQSEEALRVAAAAFDSQLGMMVTDARNVILRVNLAFTEITGYRPEEAVGQTPSLLSSGRHDAAFFDAMWHSIAVTGKWQGEIWNRHKNGEVFPEWLTTTAVKNEAGQTTHYVASFSDISARKTAEDQIKNLAFYDPLTALPNRRLLLDRLEVAMVNSVRHQRKGALLFVDLDDFKTLNDTLGHHQGDLLLEQVAQRLSACIRDGDTVARLGGDEFVVMLEDLSGSTAEAVTQAETVGEKMLSALNHIYLLGSHEYHITPSIGITLFGGDPHELLTEPLKRADLAMYQAKAAGRNTLRFYDPLMQAVVSARAALETGLREALERNQFLLHYQAQVDSNGHVTGSEALVRWQHPQRGVVSPVEFIHLAEETGLILPLGRWVLETACTQLALWGRRPEMAHLTLAVNVSARQFQQPDFVDMVLLVLEHTGAKPQRLKLELTEGMLVAGVEDVISKMTALKGKGIGFSLDDFGTGYSSLAYLKRLPLDQLKIDQGFVRNVLTDANDAAIAKMVVVLAGSLGLAVIAEGVETEAQRDFLASQGCHAHQGYFFSRPLPVSEFEAFANLH